MLCGIFVIAGLMILTLVITGGAKYTTGASSGILEAIVFLIAIIATWSVYNKWKIISIPNFVQEESLQICYSRRSMYAAAAAVMAVTVVGVILLWWSQTPNTTKPRYVYHYARNGPHYPGVQVSNVSVDCFPPGTATVGHSGRLGNKIFEYVSLWTIAHIYNISAFVPEEIHKRLTTVFEKLDLPRRSDFLWKTGCSADSLERARKSLHRPNLEVTPLSQIVEDAKKGRFFILLDDYIIMVETIVPLIDEVRSNLKFCQKYKNLAQQKLSNIKAAVHAENSSDVQVVFVGVHVRRTDYANQLRFLYNLSRQADHNYYGRAMLFLKSKVDLSGGELVPVVASDDPQWVVEVLLPHLRRLGFVHSYLLGDGRQEAPENDLVVLSSCNHSVIAYGTYGIWTAIMAGGQTVVYNLSHGDAVSPAMQFAQHLPQWVALS